MSWSLYLEIKKLIKGARDDIKMEFAFENRGDGALEIQVVSERRRCLDAGSEVREKWGNRVNGKENFLVENLRTEVSTGQGLDLVQAVAIQCEIERFGLSRAIFFYPQRKMYS